MRSFRALAFAILVSLPAAVLVSPSALAEGVLRVTTGSAEYCEELSTRLAMVEARTGEAGRQMAEDGRRLCRDGHVRAGIAKLRRALRAAQEVRLRG